MSNLTDILSQIEQGDAHAAEQLLPLVYDELRKLASAQLAHENPGQTLQATALVHDAYLRLVGGEHDVRWNSRGHFFGAAAEAMRRILVENARKKKRLKRGGGLARQELNESNIAAPEVSDQLLALDEALNRLAASDQRAARLVQLRYFAGSSRRIARHLAPHRRSTVGLRSRLAARGNLSRINGVAGPKTAHCIANGI